MAMTRSGITACGLLLSLSLGGCVTDDPSKGGFLGGIAGLTTGAYDKRLETQKNTLEEHKQRQAEAERANAELKAQLAAREREAQQLKAQTASLDREIAKTNARLQRLGGDATGMAEKRKAMVANLTRIKKEIAALNKEITQESDSADNIKIAINKKKAELVRIDEDADAMERLMGAR